MKLFSTQKEIALHVAFWAIYFLGYFITLNPDSKILYQVESVDLFSVTFLLTTISTFYVNYFVVLKTSFKSHKLLPILLGFIAIFAYFIFCRYFLEEVVALHLFGTSNYFEGTSLPYYILDNIHWASTPILASSALWIIINFIRTLQNQVVITEEKKQAEIQFLKSQINPHFIFNTLNNIYSLVVSKSEKSLDAIEKLSNIMRFTTYETQKERINIQEEINYISSLIDLEAIRMSKPIQIQVEVSIDTENQEIPPYLILPFVENCIKHGIIDSVENPALISVNCNQNVLTILAENKINSNLKDQHSGIGFENLKKRLDYYFPNKYKWDIERNETHFKSTLIIQL